MESRYVSTPALRYHEQETDKLQSMLMHYIEEVKGVQQVMDQEEEVAMQEFAKFEEKLRAQKGADAVASSGDKGTLDAAP